jgi:hypothetical protein
VRSSQHGEKVCFDNASLQVRTNHTSDVFYGQLVLLRIVVDWVIEHVLSISVDVRTLLRRVNIFSFLTHYQGAGVPITSSKLYTAGGTDDLRQALMYLSKRFPNAPLLGIGYSLGANIMTRYAAEEGRRCRFAAACVMANVRFVF